MGALTAEVIEKRKPCLSRLPCDFRQLSGGSDETRTRDLRRDRSPSATSIIPLNPAKTANFLTFHNFLVCRLVHFLSEKVVFCRQRTHQRTHHLRNTNRARCVSENRNHRARGVSVGACRLRTEIANNVSCREPELRSESILDAFWAKLAFNPVQSVSALNNVGP